LWTGYGFLSESAPFASLLVNSNITWVGPPPDVLHLFGDKIQARQLAQQSNVPVVRGSGNLSSGEECLSILNEGDVRLPAIMKAAYGGGGRGMRIVRSINDVTASFDSCQREALTAFGRDEVFLEEFWEDTKHLEVQILADGQGGVVHLFERDCTVQHRHQKVIELAPARDIHPELRKRLVDCAVTLAKSCNYKGAGTVEFLVRGELNNADTEFVFMEVNPRVQVEHTVTEEATGIDIVQAQLLIAGGRSLKDLNLTQDNIRLRQHSLQARITMMPGKGEVLNLYEEPIGEGVRCDSAGWYTGFTPNQMYDPLIGKLICSADGVTKESFEDARQLMLQSLDGFNIEGVANNIKAVERILKHPEFVANNVNTSFLVDNPELLDPSKAKIEHGTASRQYSEEKITFELTPPMTGNILEVKKQAGDPVEVGEVVVVLSAMKIETEMVSPVKGVVSAIHCKAGEQVAGDSVVAVLEGYEEIEIDITTTTLPSQMSATKSGGIIHQSDPSMEVWRGSDDFVPQYNVNDGGLSLPIIKSIPESQLTDTKAQERRKRNEELKLELSSKLEAAKLGGGESAVAKHKKRGKMLARERIAAIIDPGSSFLEVGALAGGNGLYASDGIEDLPSGGTVGGIGVINGRECMIVANDATVKGGTYFPITVKKHLRAQQIAAENRLPCIYLVDSGGAYLPKQNEVFPDKNDFGRIFFNQANMSAAGIPQLACVLGMCTAGGAYVPAMSDESVIVKGNGTIYLAGPPLVKAATQEVVSAEELGGADIHTSISGVADHYAKDEPSALSKMRQIVGSLPSDQYLQSQVLKNNMSSFVEEPLYPLSDLLSIIPEDNRTPFDVKQVLARTLDGSRFHE